jgi:sarcosine oxidase
MRRWPPFRLSGDIHGLYQPESGIVMAARANAAHQRLARSYGATLRATAAVGAIEQRSGEFVLELDDLTCSCRRLVITAGAWSNRVLASFGCRLPLTITQEQVTYFAARRLEDFQPSRFPIWIWMDDPCFYGFPVFGENGVKVGQDAGGQEVTAETRTFEADEAALQRVRGFLEKYLPTVLGPILYTRTCLYTLTPDRDFVIDRVPEHPHVLIAIGGGHGFKFASLVGKILADMAIDGRTDHDLTPFHIDRAILRLANPPKHYMV